MDLKYTAIPVHILLKEPQLFEGIEVHVKIGEKLVKLNYAGDEFLQIIHRLEKKGIDQMYVQESDFELVIAQFQDGISPKKFYDPKTTDEARVEKAEAMVTVVRDYIKAFGASKETVEVLKASNQRIQEMLNNSPGLHAFVKRFKASCGREFMKSNVTNFVCALVINEFSWRSQLIIQKTMLAGMLCDITLSSADFEAIENYEKHGGELPDYIRNHPVDAAEILKRKRDIIPMETITCVEQHHERPDGKGYPRGADMVSRFNQLSAIFIVGQRFVDLLFRHNFDYGKHHEIIKELQLTYTGGPFEKAMDALIKVVES